MVPHENIDHKNITSPWKRDDSTEHQYVWKIPKRVTLP